jgi:hypothetical protein
MDKPKDIEKFLIEFEDMDIKDKFKLILESKMKWNDRILTSRMQQLL